MMRLVMTLLVRDEQDIIRHNLDYHLARGVDFVIATDNLSQDRTPDILREYERQGKLRLLHEPDDTYAQHKWVTSMARQAFTEYGADWVINNDADEFWWPRTGSLKDALAQVPPEVDILAANRCNFLVEPGESDAPFFARMVNREVVSLNALGNPLPPKVAHRGSAAVEVAQGNHAVAGLRDGPAASGLVDILHFPVRDYAQIENKIAKGGAAYARNTELPRSLGATWRTLFDELREHGHLRSYFGSVEHDDHKLAIRKERGEVVEDRRLADFMAARSDECSGDSQVMAARPMMPRVSIIIPVHDDERYLRQCLSSVRKQSLAEIEIICIDDASCDGSPEILREAARQDGRIQLIFNERNLGPGPSRNRGLAMATGDFVRLVDADDLLPPDSTELLYQRALATGAGAVRGTLARFGEGISTQLIRRTDRHASAFRDDPDLWVPWWHTSYLVRANIIRDNAIRFPNLRRGEDPVFMAGVLVHADAVSVLDRLVYLYRAYPKDRGAAGTRFSDVVDSFHHAARVKALYLEHCPAAWTDGYGPFLLEDFRKFLGRCALDAHQAAFVNCECAQIWGIGDIVVAAPVAPGDAAAVSTSAPRESEYWNGLFAREDPWDYGNAYEQMKYGHTLELLAGVPASRVIELGCAEGHFTAMLAPLAGRLLAVDISAAALARAKSRCVGLDNVDFLEFDIADGIPGDDHDLIVCSEVLYYLRDAEAVTTMAERARDSLRLGGHVILTHARVVSDDPTATGFDFNEIGAKFIGDTFCACEGLEFVLELRTDLYYIQLFRRTGQEGVPDHPGPREVLQRSHAPISHPAIKWGGCQVTLGEARNLWRTRDVPVLMYHRIADDGPEALAPYRVSPAQFERQLAWLSRNGWHGMDLAAYCRHRFSGSFGELPGKPVILTFDDAYRDFYHSAFPLLHRYGFSATVFVPVDFVGDCAQWDAQYGPPAEIMGWEEMAHLRRHGIAFGSHSCAHQRASEMGPEALLADAVRSKAVIEEKLGGPVTGFCYPYASADPHSREVIRQAGYDWAVCGRGGNPPDLENPYYIPRIEVIGGEPMEHFIARLPSPREVDEGARQNYLRLRARRDRATYMPPRA